MDIDVKPSDFGIERLLEPEEINQLTVRIQRVRKETEKLP